MASYLSKATVSLNLISANFLWLLLFSCQHPQKGTYVTERLPMIDSSDFISIKKKFQYEHVDTLRTYLGGLRPKVPIAEVYSSYIKESSIWRSEGMFLVWYSLVMKVKDSLVLIDSERKFKEVFAPIESEQEAISYVAYLTRTYPRYDIDKKRRYRVYSTHFPSTYAKRVEGGFEVLLHDNKKYGCGPHPYFYKIFKVTDSGDIKLIENVKMYEDPEDDALCVD